MTGRVAVMISRLAVAALSLAGVITQLTIGAKRAVAVRTGA